MNIRQALCALCALSVFVVSTQGRAADSPVALTDIVSEKSLFVTHVSENGEYWEKWQRSPFQKIWEDESLRNFFAPLLDEESQWYQTTLALTKAGQKIPPLFTGEVMLVIHDLPLDKIASLLEEEDYPDPEEASELSSEEDEPTTDNPLSLNFKIGDLIPNIAWIGTLEDPDTFYTEMKSLAEEVQSTLDDQIQLQSAQEEDTQIERLLYSAEGEETLLLTWTHVEGIGLIATSSEYLQELTNAIKEKGAPQPFSASPWSDFVAKRGAGADLTFAANLQVLVDQFDQFLQDELGEDFDEQSAAMGMKRENLLKSFGLTDLRHWFISSEYTETGSRTHQLITYNSDGPLGQLFDLPESELPKINFFPHDVILSSTAQFKIKTAWDYLLNCINTLSPVLGGLLTNQITIFEAQMGISLEEDLFGSLGETVFYLQMEPTTHNRGSSDEPASTEEISKQFGHLTTTIYGLAIADQQRLESTFATLRSTLENYGVPLLETEYLDQKIFSIEMPQAESEGDEAPAEPIPASFSYCISKDYLLLCIGEKENLQQLLSNMKKPSGSLWESEPFVDLLEESTPGYVSTTYQNNGAAIYGGLISLMQIQALLPNKYHFCDPEALPSKKSLEQLFGYNFSTAYSEPDGIYTENMTLITP